MNHSEFATLMHIGGANKCLNEEKVKVSTLSERMRINITAVSRTLKVLEKKNYIQRTVSAQDRRITYVELTPGGGRGTGGSGGNNEYIYGKGAKQPEKEDVIRLTALMNQLYEASEAEIEKRKRKVM